MKRITATDTLDLSIPERIQLVEDIWDTITAKADARDISPNTYRFCLPYLLL